MKKILIPVLAAAALLLGAAPKQLLAVSIPAADHGWTGGVVWWANRTKTEIERANPDVRVVISTAGNSAEQVNKIENLLVRRPGALVVLPQEPAPLTGICERAKKAGVRVVVVDRGLTRDVQDVIVAGDNAEFGRRCAGEMARLLGGRGKIVIMEGIPCEVNSQRVNAFREVLKKYPDIEVLESLPAYWSTSKGLKLMANYLRKHRVLDGVWAGDDDVLAGALKAYEESGRKDVKVFIGGGGSKAIVRKVLDRDPRVPVDVTYPPRMIAEGMKAGLELIRGKTPQAKCLVVPAEVVTPENAKNFYFPDSVY